MTRQRSWAFIICLLLWTVYGVVAWVAVRGKSATYDEPNHAAVGWFMLHRADYRPSPDVPPLWEYFIALPLGSSAIHYDPADPGYRNILPAGAECVWTLKMFYRTAGNDGIAIVQKCRAMALMLAIVLGMLISFWGWKLAGPIAAVAATTLWAFDPNMLGHGPLAKNDIAIALVYAWLGFALWSAGTRFTWRSGVSLCLAIAVAPGIKLSGIVFLPVAVFVLFVRALMPRPWPVLKWSLERWVSKLGVVFVFAAISGVVAYILLWASYGFRYNAGPGNLRLDTDLIETVLRQHMAEPGAPAWQPDLTLRGLDFARAHHLLPEAWIAGCYYTRMSTIHRGAYLLGENYSGGKWDYFPLAFLFKEPLATLGAVIISVVVAFAAVRHGRLKGNSDAQWTALSLGIPGGIYAAAALSANINLGLRYLFPIYPFIFVSTGWAIVSLWKGSRFGKGLLLALAAGLIVETAGAYPDFIAFFNVACGGSRGGISLLDDSNLDWGQDLPLLAQWQQGHPNDKLYLIYFGLCDPSAYHIRSTRLAGHADLESYPQWPTTGGVVAISATSLQVSNPDDFAHFFRQQSPEAVLGGSIYLFRFDHPPILPETRQVASPPSLPENLQQ